MVVMSTKRDTRCITWRDCVDGTGSLGEARGVGAVGDGGGVSTVEKLRKSSNASLSSVVTVPDVSILVCSSSVLPSMGPFELGDATGVWSFSCSTSESGGISNGGRLWGILAVDVFYFNTLG